MSVDCLFCKIIQREISGTIVYEDDDVLAFKDVMPQAPVHLLVVPKKHYAKITDFQEPDQDLIGKIILAANQLAKENNIDEEGFRLVANCNEKGGQTVSHVHFHLLGGRQMDWPPG